MHQNKKNQLSTLTRRKFFKVGVGTAGGVVATSAMAQVCGGSQTAEQPLGPFFPRPGTPELNVHESDDPNQPHYLANDNDLTFVKGKDGRAVGQVVYVRGRVQDAVCNPIRNASLIIWQASSTGRYNHLGDADNHDFSHPRTGALIKRDLDPHFQYWGRTLTDGDGRYLFKTIVPGFYPANIADGWYRPPHIHMMVSATGFPQLVTQLYFRGQEIHDHDWIQTLNKRDYLLQSKNLSDAERQALVVQFTSVAQVDPGFDDGLVGDFDLALSR